jgi:RNA recognition motif-containing protein
MEESQTQDLGPSSPDDDKRNLIVNYIPNTLTPAAFRNMFTPFGSIEKCRIVFDKLTGLGMGYGFVKYQTAEAASKAIDIMNGQLVENKTLKVSYARPASRSIQHANLYVAQLDKGVTKADLDNIFSPYGTLIESKILLDPSTGQSRGVAFVRYDTQEQAQSAIRALNGVCLPGMSTPITVKHADTPDDKKRKSRVMTSTGSLYNVRYDPMLGARQLSHSYIQHHHMQGIYSGYFAGQAATGIGSQTFCLFVYSLPNDADESLLYRIFGPFGAIANVKVIRDPSGRSKGYGFVHFLKYEDAHQAVMSLNGYQLGNKFLQVSFKAPKKSNINMTVM